MRKKVYYHALQPSDTTSFWRMCGTLSYIQDDEIELVDISNVREFNWSTFVDARAFILQRPFEPKHMDLIRLCRDMDIPVILDYDDHLLDVPETNPTHHQYQHFKPNVIDCLKAADEIWVSTPTIAKAYSPYNRNIHVIPNAHNDYLFPISGKLPYNINTKKAFNRGGQSHQADVLSVADDIIRVVNENQDWTFTFMGDRFTYLEQRCDDNYHILHGMTLMQYFKYIQLENPNVFFFPLVDNEFNRGKSNICWLEATYSGAAFYGNLNMPEYPEGMALSMNDFGDFDHDVLRAYNEWSWDYIKENLLLSKVNLLRLERLRANVD